MSDALAVSHLRKRYPGVLAVDDVSFDLAVGETLAIIGPNGAGKTTVFNMIAGETRSTSGEVFAFGSPVTHWPPSRLARLGIARTFQISRVFLEYTAWENVAVSVDAASRKTFHGWNRFVRDDIAQRVDKCLDEVGIDPPLRGIPASTLSHGDKKRLELAMAVVQEPRLLLLDEPTAGMSSRDSAEIIVLLNQIRKTHDQLSILITAHDMDLVFGVASRVILMADGQILVAGTPYEVAHDERTVSVYLGRGVPS